MINKYTHDTSLQAITDMNVGHPWLGRIVGYGEIDLLTAAEAGTSKIRFLPGRRRLPRRRSSTRSRSTSSRSAEAAPCRRRSPQRLSRSGRSIGRHVGRRAGHRAQPPGGHERPRPDHPGRVRPEEARAARPAQIGDARGLAAAPEPRPGLEPGRGDTLGAGLARREDAPAGRPPGGRMPNGSPSGRRTSGADTARSTRSSRWSTGTARSEAGSSPARSPTGSSSGCCRSRSSSSRASASPRTPVRSLLRRAAKSLGVEGLISSSISNAADSPNRWYALLIGVPVPDLGDAERAPSADRRAPTDLERRSEPRARSRSSSRSLRLLVLLLCFGVVVRGRERGPGLVARRPARWRRCSRSCSTRGSGSSITLRLPHRGDRLDGADSRARWSSGSASRCSRSWSPTSSRPTRSPSRGPTARSVLAAALLFGLFLISRLIVASAVVNATLWERRAGSASVLSADAQRGRASARARRSASPSARGRSARPSRARRPARDCARVTKLDVITAVTIAMNAVPSSITNAPTSRPKTSVGATSP